MIETLLSYAGTLNAMRAMYMRCVYVTSEQKRKYARVRDAFTSTCSLTTADNVSKLLQCVGLYALCRFLLNEIDF